MKKNIIKYVLAVAVVAVAGMGVYQAQNKGIELSEVSLANVEALASGEWGPYETSHSYPCPPPVEYKTGTSCTPSGWEYCFPSDC